MVLFYMPGACSLAPHIVAETLDIPVKLEKVSRTKEWSGGNYLEINPKGVVPALLLDDGQLLTEAAAVLMYLGDLHPEKHLMPKAGTFERYKAYEGLNFISTELHKGFGPLWNKNASDEVKNMAIENLNKKLIFVETKLSEHKFILGDSFTVADAYLFTILNWSNYLNFDLTNWPNIKAYLNRVLDLSPVQRAMDAEGLKRPKEALPPANGR